MLEKLGNAFRRACCTALMPIARVCIASGISHKEFIELSRIAFVNAAKKELSNDTKKLTNSRIAARTGFTRREVSYARRLIKTELNSSESCLPLTFVLTEWHENVRYSDANGRPVKLPLRQKEGDSLEKLIGETIPDLPANAVVQELEHYGCIKQT